MIGASQGCYLVEDGTKAHRWKSKHKLQVTAHVSDFSLSSESSRGAYDTLLYLSSHLTCPARASPSSPCGSQPSQPHDPVLTPQCHLPVVHTSMLEGNPLWVAQGCLPAASRCWRILVARSSIAASVNRAGKSIHATIHPSSQTSNCGLGMPNPMQRSMCSGRVGENVYDALDIGSR
ncbi:uncharacterized protein LY89DRAFT_331769 [Mollisia scopiformis]|uniref:Uncharacterized protein n=1 Tax=Mollisia scopiformis TaxID=149040 RepID=A0A132B9Y9_MOLSC|nr:uncharacterized protein LY89DRAFT_331769 [Mollisia scopiformis]KUJ08487.1 hypothetical protein LY89DRAFT_331769 [Mollisia scopiformis]